MFFAVLFIAIGLAILLSTLGIMNGTFWGFFWALFFIVVGVKMMIRKGRCPVCGWHHWEGRIHDKIHAKMDGHCCEHHEHNGGEQR